MPTSIRTQNDYNTLLHMRDSAEDKTLSGIGPVGTHYYLISALAIYGRRATRDNCVQHADQLLREWEEAHPTGNRFGKRR